VAMNPMEQFTIGPILRGNRPVLPVHMGHHDLTFTNQSMWMCIVVAAASLFLTLAVARPRLVPGRLQSVAELAYEFVANMIRSAAGEDGLVFFPFVFTIFVFVLFSNFFGLIPGAFTVTSQIAVTFALACLVMVAVIVTGIAVHGIGFLKLFVPHAPWYLLLLLVPIELISFMTRPISLSVRLFANMLAGHTMLKVFASFVIALGGAAGIALKLLSVAPMFLIVAITALELLVAFLQAYVFAILTCIYLNEALHLHEQH
jgi:F-type H+-transporting ATPase subunit a